MLRKYQSRLSKALARLDDSAIDALDAKDLAAVMRVVGYQIVALSKVAPRDTEPSENSNRSDAPLQGLRLVNGAA
jgi:hypothetical protein